MNASGGPIRTCLGCRLRLPIGTLIGVRRRTEGLMVVRLAGWPVPEKQLGQHRREDSAKDAHPPEPVVDYAARDPGPGKGGYVCPRVACVERAWRSRPRSIRKGSIRKGSVRRKGAVEAAAGAKAGNGGPGIECGPGIEGFEATGWLDAVTALAARWLALRQEGLRRRRLDGAADPQVEAWKALVQRVASPGPGPTARTRRAKAWSTTRGSVDLGGGDDSSSV